MSTPSAPAPSRLAFVDLLRAVASSLIVWHHLAFYGPLSDVAAPLAPGVFDWLSTYGRMAVQVFLVLGGFMLMRGLASSGGMTFAQVGRALGRRYVRLAWPYLFALVLAVVANALARRWMDHPSISGPPSFGQLLAHVLLLQDVLGHEALSAGVWYLAIDFQLAAVGLLLFWLAGKWAPRAQQPVFLGLCAVLAVASLLFLNRQTDLDVFAVYFFGSYALGIAAERMAAGALPRWGFWGLVLLAAGVGHWDDRPRLLVAAGTAAALVLVGSGSARERWRAFRPVQFLARISYALFLAHFPVCLVVSAAAMQLSLSPLGALLAMGGCWLASVGVAFLLHRVEQRPPPLRALSARPMPG